MYAFQIRSNARTEHNFDLVYLPEGGADKNLFIDNKAAGEF